MTELTLAYSVGAKILENTMVTYSGMLDGVESNIIGKKRLFYRRLMSRSGT
jgi:hypothetical protein